MAIDPIYVGQDVQARMTVKDPDGAVGNPASVRFKVKSPNGTVTIYQSGDPEVVVITAGSIYGCNFDVDQNGKWTVRSEALNGASAVVGVDEFSFWVNQSGI